MRPKELIIISFAALLLSVGCSPNESSKPVEPGPATVQIFMSASDGMECGAVEPLQRHVDKKTPKVVLEALLKGPSSEEILKGAYTSIERGAKLLSVQEEGDVVIADFSGIANGKSCRVKAIQNQIARTITDNFPGKSAKILVDGKPATPQN